MGHDEDDEVLCRYCFGDEADGPLISPCKCSGGQKFVHLDCLRRWQRMVLVSQPTHPAFYTDDKRHHICNVCLARYTCPPPTRAELMASFTGPEIAALIETHRLIAASPGFSEMLEADRNADNDHRVQRRPSSSYDYWFHGVYLINQLMSDSGEMELSLPNDALLNNFRRRLTPDPDDPSRLEMHFHGALYVVTLRGSLEGVAPADVPTAIAALTPPATLYLQQKDSLATCADDHVTAVCISRPLAHLDAAQEAVASAIRRLGLAYPTLRRRLLDETIQVQHFAGGPCDPQRISTCLVLGGALRGYTLIPSLDDALLHAYRLFAAAPDCTLSPGQAVRVQGLVARPEINGELGMALKFEPKAGRWHVRLVNSTDGIKVKPSNLEVFGTPKPTVYVIWGDAQWTRAQLLGEIARGSWGLCRAMVDDMLRAPSERWDALQREGRLAFAPVSEMTEDYVRQATEEMVALRSNAVAADEATTVDAA
ncbi:hypothetical protein SPRG_11359 [Saprolegnia parasitica CBS 223.65]|uniref:RING-CH-type domain-containing protein n=1 Tax=Saprolegnia parasitica (strain CBS 223.65) TaxID=695850 RepID=A0A067C6G8_SAPPC|nr:hypothetical protein SPRG_11359 [Saprolegnia parasitica CBS 223.65]KDO22407.1 hypothetical protein SPRG_11359 [Saprolegnia parasitica CBS 223.65]|eukprot:XP_012206930.1 hypothetical protein SPRG_11359 [Saprolegnia parasitica CBS 223.65]